ncbi:MAG: zinc ribbon domain-containing protein [Acidimicrobiia bacterium]
MIVFDRLLEIQGHDGVVDRLRHRRETLSERPSLAQAQARVAALDVELDAARLQRDEAARRERQLEEQIALLTGRVKEVEGRLYSGSVSSPRELQALQADADQLRRQRRDHEDRELEVMEAREDLDRRVAVLEERRQELEGEASRLGGVIADAERTIDAEIAAASEERRMLAEGLEATLLSLYEATRVANRGVGAARLEGGKCQGCHLALAATEVDRIRQLPRDILARCEHCGTILVRG